jgi:hypothetical protein
MAATTTLLDLVTPTQGTLSGTWGDTVNYGISDYLDIAIAGTLTFTGDGAITLTNTIGSASGNNIGATTGQYMVIRVTGTLTTAKIITAPSRSKLYMVDNSATGSTVSFIRAGQTPAVSVAVGEKCFVYYNGTDYVKVASSVADGVTTIDFGSTGLTPATATSGAVTVAGTLAIANGGTGTTSTTFANLTTNVTGTLPVANGGTGITSLGAGIATFLGTPSSANLAAALTDETGTGSAVFATSPTLVTPALGTPTALVLTSATGLPLTTGVTGILPVANGGTATATPSLVQGSGVTITGTWPNQTIAATGSGGTVTTISVASANGLAGTSSGGATPALTLSTSITGVLKGDGTALSAATAGTDYVAPGGALGTPASGTLTNTTGLPLTTGVTGILPVANGGTNLSSGTSGGVLAYTASGTLASSAALAANNVVVGGGAGAAPSSTNLLAISAAVTTGNYIKAIGYADTVTALGNTGTAINLDVTSGGVFTATLNGNTTITLRYPVATGASSFVLILTNDGTPNRTVAFSGGTFKYPGGTVTRTTTASAIDIWFFFTPDGGTTYYASIPMANLS